MLAAGVLAALTPCLLCPLPAWAGAYCPDVNNHCYSILEGVNTPFIGAGGHWNRANMTTPSSQQLDYFVDSEMWLKPDCAVFEWVEEGLTVWWDPIIGTGAYESFFAYYTPGGTFVESAQEYLLPHNETDSYSIGRGAYQNTWTGDWNNIASYNRTSADEGFWTANCVQMGGEIWSSNGHADTFNMYGYGINASGQHVNWGTQGGIITDTTQLNGFSYSNSEWSWNTVA
jgi:hypothetical protein